MVMSSVGAVCMALIGSVLPRPYCCLLSLKRHAGSWNKRQARKEELADTVFQYAGKNVQRADRIYAWGCAATGSLGLRTLLRPEKKARARMKQLTPYRINTFQDRLLKVKEVSCGYGFSLFLCKTSDRRSVAYGTGLNSDSQLGYQEFPPKSGRLLDHVIDPVPIELPLVHPASTRLTHVACGRAHTVIATDKEGVFTLGNNSYGQCGRRIVDREEYRGSQTINKLLIPGSIKQLVCGQDHTLFLTDSGEVYSCGLGSAGQTGLGHYEPAAEPSLVRGDIEGQKIVHLSCKADTVLAVSAEGRLFGWGNSEHNQLGEQDWMQMCVPIHIALSDSVGRVTHAACTASMCALVNENGEVFTWGVGILGKGPIHTRCSAPERIPQRLFGASDFNPGVKVKDIQAGLDHFAALNDIGDLFVWGKNREACLGLGHSSDQFFPYKVQVSAEVTRIGCGVDHMIVLSKSFV